MFLFYVPTSMSPYRCAYITSLCEDTCGFGDKQSFPTAAGFHAARQCEPHCTVVSVWYTPYSILCGSHCTGRGCCMWSTTYGILCVDHLDVGLGVVNTLWCSVCVGPSMVQYSVCGSHQAEFFSCVRVH